MMKNSSLVRNLKIDMTPLVDISFILLLSFFVVDFYRQKNFLTLNMPIKQELHWEGETGCGYKEANVMTILMGSKDDIFVCFNYGKFDSTRAIKSNLNHLVQDIIDSRAKAIDTSRFMIFIKPSEYSSYGSVVNVLSDIRKTHSVLYSIVDLSQNEIQFLDKRYSSL